MKIRLVRAKLPRADGPTNMTKLIVALHNFAKAPKMEIFSVSCLSQPFPPFVPCNLFQQSIYPLKYSVHLKNLKTNHSTKTTLIEQSASTVTEFLSLRTVSSVKSL